MGGIPKLVLDIPKGVLQTGAMNNNETTTPTAPQTFDFHGHCCDDCLQWSANADSSGIDDEVRRSEVESGLPFIPYGVDDVDNHDFATFKCDVCGTRLAGRRWAGLVTVTEEQI